MNEKNGKDVGIGDRIGDLPQVLRALAEKLDTLRDETNKTEAMSMGDVVHLMATLRDLRDGMKAAKAGIQKLYDHVSINVVPEIMEEQGLENVTVGDYRLEIANLLRVSAPAPNREQLAQWFRDRGMENMVSETINASSLKAMVKSAMADGADYPAELIKIEPYQQAKVVKR